MIVAEGVVWKIRHHEGATAIEGYPMPMQQSFLCSEFLAWREKQAVNETSEVSVDRGVYQAGKAPSAEGEI